MAFFENRAMSPDRAAQPIVAAMGRGSERLLITPEAHVGDPLERPFPAVPSRWIAWIHGRVV